mmetsp:Transcript_57213/g.163051  ORF Transcript_57213/g.163051 Transcript_57213/m.163051 type:complete len:160 (-) Transcript_57213:1301-1780(-)
MTLTNVLLKDVAGYSDTKKVADASAGKRLLLKIYGEIHDVTDYSSRHPGGKLLLEQVAALDLPDATPLFESYHALVDAKTMRHVLKPMATGEKVPEMYSFEHDGFYATLRIAHTGQQAPSQSIWANMQGYRRRLGPYQVLRCFCYLGWYACRERRVGSK